MYASVALGTLWIWLATVALLRLGKRGLWMLVGARLVIFWPMMFALLYWTCKHGFDCM
jgi:hypothetical protein